MTSELGDEESDIVHLLYDPFRVGASLSYPFEDIKIFQGLADLLRVSCGCNLKRFFEDLSVVSRSVIIL